MTDREKISLCQCSIVSLGWSSICLYTNTSRLKKNWTIVQGLLNNDKAINSTIPERIRFLIENYCFFFRDLTEREKTFSRIKVSVLKSTYSMFCTLWFYCEPNPILT